MASETGFLLSLSYIKITLFDRFDVNLSVSLYLSLKWLATCARKPKVPGSSYIKITLFDRFDVNLSRARLPAMCRGELSAVIFRLMSKCL